jgi:RNA 3'-phosphate cyclase
MQMIVEIDGATLEGGGQILRSAIAIAAVRQIPVRVKNIRAKRSTPGLRPQHLHGIFALQQITKAQVKGTHEGSKEIEFVPHNLEGGNLKVNIGTAGSISLILQGLMIAAPFCKNPVTAQLTGGTNVAWSPPIDYLQYVLLPRLEQLGYSGNVLLEKRGYYPRGGGRVSAKLSPCPNLTAIALTSTKNEVVIKGISHCGNLPQHVANRQAQSATNILKQSGFQQTEIKSDQAADIVSRGSGISLWAHDKKNRPNKLLGTDALGRRGLKAELVGTQAAESLLKELNTNAPVDCHQADMLIPYVALAKGQSDFSISSLSLHTITNIYIVEQFLDVKFKVKGEQDNPAQISVTGIGLENALAFPEQTSNSE